MKKRKGRVLIVDDNEELLIAYEMFLSPHFESIRTLNNPNAITSLLKEAEFDVILLDMNFSAGIQSGNEGFYWMNRILEIDGDASIILLTAYGDIELAIRAIREGATDFILKSWDKEKILSTILTAWQLRQSRKEIRTLKSRQQHLLERENQNYDFSPVHSDRMKDLLRTVGKVAPTDASILILGENGTGKEVLAREIHRLSLRSSEIFVSIDLGTITESLFESELFGHVKGAFTGADSDRQGRIEVASGGTLFLDEIGNLPVPLQAKLLSVIEKREVTRVGSHRSLPVDIRLICATNANPYELCEEGRFREDLLYRINSIQLHLPPLRERQEDIPSLIQHYLGKYSAKYNKPGLKVSSLAIRQLQKYPWRGNIRELRNLMEKAVLLSDNLTLRPADFSPYTGTGWKGEEEQLNLENNEKRLIVKALERNGFNKKLAAEVLGINRTTLYNKIRKYGIEPV
jgi:two-component system response regulator HydG